MSCLHCTAHCRDGEAINIAYHLSQMQVGGEVVLHVLRGGQELALPAPLGVPHTLVPFHLAGRPPQYLVVSGLVLTTLSVPYLEGAFGRQWSKRAPVREKERAHTVLSSM